MAGDGRDKPGHHEIETAPYIGGATPCVPTVTRLTFSVPSAFAGDTAKIFAPFFRSSFVAGANVTTGAFGGTSIVLLLSLYATVSSRPFAAFTAPFTVPL